MKITFARSNIFRRLLPVIAVFSLAFAPLAHAASNAAGSIFGNALPGDTVVIESTDTGLVREITVGDNGHYSASQLPTGNYTVTLRRDGAEVSTRDGVTVYLNTGTNVSFDGAADLERVVVSGASVTPIDVSATDTRVVFTSEQLQKIPVGRSIVDVAILTPGVVEADSRYPGAASFGGSAASENAFYINGYAVTNPLTNLGSTSLPFDAISQFQAITGGYGAEYGRATGGVVNIVTKSGTNDYKAGGLLIWEPDSLRAEQEDRVIPNNGYEGLDGLVYQKLSERERESMTYGAYASGPIVKDKLFFYASYEQEDIEVDSLGAYNSDPSGNGLMYEYEIPRWIVKMDWNITNNHLFDFTAISDVTKETQSYYDLCYDTDPDCANPFVRGNTKNGGWYYEDGGKTYIAKYTGYLTNDLTLSALYGQQEQDHIAVPYQYDPTQVYVSDNRPGGTENHGLYSQIPFPDAYDETNGYRVDLEYRVDSHNLRFGYDFQELESRAGVQPSGPGYIWQYYNTGPSTSPIIPESGGATSPGPNEDYVVQQIYANGGTFRVEQSAMYLEDRWQVTHNWLLSLGIRSESFENFNADDIVYVEQADQIAPRIGATWDVFGDSTFKVFGQLGRYHLAMPNNVARRGAAGSTYTQEYFAFESIGADGIPQGLTPLGDGPHSANNEYGQAPNPITVAARDLKSHYQDELVLGMEKVLTDDLTFGARWVYRDLKSAIDDMCDGRPALRWAEANGYSEEDAQAFSGQLQNCRLFNPGEANTFVLEDASGDLVTLDMTQDQLGYPELKRTYMGIDLFLEHPFDGEFYYKIDYTWSKNYGNAEGQLQSDIGQGDVSQTIDWDHPEIGEFGNGYLPNDRRHYVKAFGYWQFNPEWRFSGTFLAHSGRPKNCLGYYTGPSTDWPDYGPYYHYCGGEPSPRGSEGRLPWDYKLDVGVSYMPAAVEGLTMSVDVFNLLDRQVPQNRTEIGELGGIGATYPYYGMPITHTDPRMVRFTVRYDW